MSDPSKLTVDLHAHAINPDRLHVFATLPMQDMDASIVEARRVAKYPRTPLELLGRRIGWSQVVLGSDYPFDMASDDPVAGVEAVTILTEEERAAVLCTNADRFLRPCLA